MMPGGTMPSETPMPGGMMPSGTPMPSTSG
jgi:hypothetical protein